MIDLLGKVIPHFLASIPNCIAIREPPYAERHVRWCERSENDSRKKTASFSSYSMGYGLSVSNLTLSLLALHLVLVRTSFH